jgi:general secretion pathway protein A
MYQKHWDLTGQPFPSRVGAAQFFESPTHEEALARLQFLVEQHQRIGLLLGASGSGKSLLLKLFAQALVTTGRQVVRVNLLGLDCHELTRQLASQLEVTLTGNATPAKWWRSIVDRIVANRYQSRDTVLLLDDADEADRDVLARIARLSECDPSTQCRLTMVLAAYHRQINQLGPRLLELTELRVEIEPWDPEDTRDYLRHALSHAGGQREVFDEAAIERLHQLAHGVPRRVSQLAGLALIAGAGEQKDEIDSETVNAAYEQLAVLATNVPAM